MTSTERTSATTGDQTEPTTDALQGIARQYVVSLIENKNADAIGEILRAWAFVGKGFGCYSNFDIRPEFAKVDVTPREFSFLWGRQFDPDDKDQNSWGYCDCEAIKEVNWFKHPCGIEMGWRWDGDGCLAFYVPELNAIFSNGDCKCDYDWRFHDLLDQQTPLKDHQS